MAEAIPQACLLPGMVPDEELPALWRTSIAPFFDSQPLAGPDVNGYRPSIRQYHLGQAMFVDTDFAAQQFRRDPAWMAQNDDADHLLLQVFLRGSNQGSNGGSDFSEQPGNIFAVNLSRTVEARSTDAETLTLVLPRDLLARTLPQLLGATGALFEDGSASARIFVDHMLSLRRYLGIATTAEIPALLQGTLGLLDSLTRHRDGGSSAAGGATLAAICRHIEQHLQDPDLDVDSLCRQFRCSRATIYRLFKPLGGVREHIQQRRLAGCFKAMVSPGQAHRRIFDIAMDFGFSSPSHFSTLFREHFGMTPRQAREAGMSARIPPLPPSGRGPAEDAELMRQWVKKLGGRMAPEG